MSNRSVHISLDKCSVPGLRQGDYTMSSKYLDVPESEELLFLKMRTFFKRNTEVVRENLFVRTEMI